MPKVSINNLNIHYQQVGKGPDVVLIHGITGNLSIWFLHILPLLAKKYRVTVYDLRGHGYSDRTTSGYSSDDMVEDLKGLVDYLKIERAFFVGHSFGGAIALHFAALYPQQVIGATLLDAGIPAYLHLRNLKDWRGWDLYKVDLDKIGITSEEDLLDIENAVRKSFNVPIQYGFRIGAGRRSDRLVDLVDNTSVLKDFKIVKTLTEEKITQIRTPTLCIYGTFSPWRAVGERLEQIMPNCRSVQLSDQGHFYLLQSPDVFLKLLEEFFQQVMAPGQMQSPFSLSLEAKKAGE